MKFGSCHPLNKKKGPDDTTGTIAAAALLPAAVAVASYCYDDEDLDSKRFVLSITRNGIHQQQYQDHRGKREKERRKMRRGEREEYCCRS